MDGYFLSEQWHRPPREAVMSPEGPRPWHFQRGGFPAETVVVAEEFPAAASGGSRAREPCFPLDTLLSPVTGDTRDEFSDDIRGELPIVCTVEEEGEE